MSSGSNRRTMLSGLIGMFGISVLFRRPRGGRRSVQIKKSAAAGLTLFLNLKRFAGLPSTLFVWKNHLFIHPYARRWKSPKLGVPL